MRAGITEVDQKPVAHTPGYKAAIRGDDGGNGSVVAGDQAAQRAEWNRQDRKTSPLAAYAELRAAAAPARPEPEAAKSAGLTPRTRRSPAASACDAPAAHRVFRGRFQ